MRDTALSLLRRDSVAYMDMIYPILRGDCDIIQADEDGQVIFDRPSAFVFANLPDTDGSVQKLMAVRGARGYVIHSDALSDRFERIVRKKRVMRVQQVVYEGRQAPHVARVCSVRKLTEADEDALVSSLPYDDEEDMRLLTKMGRMYGAFIAGEFAGRIGLHLEGCMGLLAVNPAFRRRGVGEALQAHLMRELLSQGITPYGQIRRDNAASMALSQTLGLTFSDGEMTILY